MSEELKTAEERAKDFVAEYGDLVKKHNIDFATYPMFVPDGQNGFKVMIQNTPVDTTPKGEPSPFVAEEK